MDGVSNFDKDVLIRRMHETLKAVHTDLLMRAETDGEDKVVDIGNGVWSKLCETLKLADGFTIAASATKPRPAKRRHGR